MWINGMSAQPTCSKSQMHVQPQGVLDGPTEAGDAEYRFSASTVRQAANVDSEWFSL